MLSKLQNPFPKLQSNSSSSVYVPAAQRCRVGLEVGTLVGVGVGRGVGLPEGSDVGTGDGRGDGNGVGLPEGSGVGVGVGTGVGDKDGTGVGYSVGYSRTLKVLVDCTVAVQPQATWRSDASEPSARASARSDSRAS